MDCDLGNGSKEGLVCLGKELDRGGETALELMEKVLKIRNRLGRSVPLAANRAQRQYECDARQRNIVLKARQMGVSTWIAGKFLLRTITHPGTVTVQVAHTQEAAEQIFRIVHRFLAHLPPSLREGALKSAKRSARRVLFPEMDSEYLVETAGDCNAGRGLTITNLHCTELARWPGHPAETLYGLMATLSPAGTLAMESTPMGASGCFWKEWQEADRTSTARHFFPWWMEDAYRGEPVPEESLTAEEQLLIGKHGLSPEQIGYRRQIRQNFRELAKQEYAEDPDECFFASGSCYFDPQTIDARLPDAPAPVEKRRSGDLRIWLSPQPGRKYLIAVDPAGGGTAGDFTAMQVIELEQAMQCAELQAHLTPFETAREAARLGREYNNALLVVERNNQGCAVLSCLDHIERYANLYRDEAGQDGFLTSSGSRALALSRLYSTLAEEPRKFMSERLLRECRTFVRCENGRTEAQAGEHDDLVLAMAIALEARDRRLATRPVQ
jgi:hypothetical protein